MLNPALLHDWMAKKRGGDAQCVRLFAATVPSMYTTTEMQKKQ